MDGEGAGAAPRERYVPARPRWRALVLVAALHASGFAVLMLAPPDAIRQLAQTRLATFDVRLAPPPPPLEPISAPPPPPQVVAPTPRVAVPVPPPPIVVDKAPDTPPPPAPPVVAPRSPDPAPPRPPAPPGDVSRDLTANIVSAPPPRYPIASRRAHEQGTVLLDVRLSVDGRVEEISVRRSSGSDRLDDAARSAVRRWRWTPTLIGGVPARVRGLVEIPFVLR
ncbi:energy transducer TonB [Roseomonas aeriglobus]|nr:energy transducer TonB [Roseomonas aeriglobus]